MYRFLAAESADLSVWVGVFGGLWRVVSSKVGNDGFETMFAFLVLARAASTTWDLELKTSGGPSGSLRPCCGYFFKFHELPISRSEVMSACSAMVHPAALLQMSLAGYVY